MRTVILSDVHVGNREANVAKFNRLLFNLECDRLILAGDIWDLHAMDPDKIRSQFSGTLDLLRKLITKGVSVSRILGDYDQSQKDPILPEIPIVSSIIETLPNGKKLAIIHGHEFDPLCSRWHGFDDLINYFGAKIGVRLRSMRSCNDLHGDAYASACRNIHDIARKRYFKLGHDLLIMGHTHSPQSRPKRDGMVELYNCGDWIEHCSYVVIEDSSVTLRHLADVPARSDGRWFRLEED